MHMGRAKHVTYEGVLHSLRILMIDNMAKPEEVIIVEDDNGEIVREQTKDTEVIALCSIVYVYRRRMCGMCVYAV
jgi:hypothetical protein